jgi:hypothetical protein
MLGIVVELAWYVMDVIAVMAQLVGIQESLMLFLSKV